VAKVENLFSPDSIFKLEDELIRDVAGETEESQIERDSSTRKLDILKKAMHILKRLEQGHNQSIPPAIYPSSARLTSMASHEHNCLVINAESASHRAAREGTIDAESGAAAMLSQTVPIEIDDQDEDPAVSVSMRAGAVGTETSTRAQSLSHDLQSQKPKNPKSKSENRTRKHYSNHGTGKKKRECPKRMGFYQRRL